MLVSLPQQLRFFSNFSRFGKVNFIFGLVGTSITITVKWILPLAQSGMGTSEGVLHNIANSSVITIGQFLYYASDIMSAIGITEYWKQITKNKVSWKLHQYPNIFEIEKRKRTKRYTPKGYSIDDIIKLLFFFVLFLIVGCMLIYLAWPSLPSS